MSEKVENKALAVSEVFYSIQGEGGQSGLPMVFIRLRGCSAKNACYTSGVICDTEFESGQTLTLDELRKYIEIIAPVCKTLLWTGGEPLDQLDDEILNYFKEYGYKNSLETSGVKSFHPFVGSFDYVTLSPKVAEHVIKKHYGGEAVDELRYVRHQGQEIPRPVVNSRRWYISPHFDGQELNLDNLDHCLTLIKRHPTWRLSLQIHKLINVL